MSLKFKFLHTSDWHFGAGRRLTPKSLDYLERHKEVLRRVIRLAVKENVDFALVSGDVFENAGTTIEELLAAFEIFGELGEVCPVIVTAGNHDELNVGNFQTKYLELLNVPNVIFVSKPQVVTIGHKNGPSHIAAVPWTGIKDQEKFNEIIRDLNLDSECKVMMLHECFKDITLDSGMVSKIGVGIPDIPTVRYYACGDIHKYQRVQLDRAWYSGAPLQYNFGDQTNKGAIIVDVDQDDIYTPRYIQIQSPIELHNIHSLDEIPKDSPHWYKLRVDAANVPRVVPQNVKTVDPIPRPVDRIKEIVASMEDGKEVEHMEEKMSIDFTDGVAELLAENGFTPEEILETCGDVQKVVATL